MLPRGRCARSHSDGRTTCLRDRMLEANEPRPSTACSDRPSLDGVDPEAYLSLVLRRIADHSINRIADLVP